MEAALGRMKNHRRHPVRVSSITIIILDKKTISQRESGMEFPRVGTDSPENKKGANLVSANPLLILAPQRGLEPRTRWLTAICSTD